MEERESGVMMRTLLLMLCLLPCAQASAHHIMGIPHYAYDEQYPQVPILTYAAEVGPNELQMTGYPGIPAPGERCTLHVYIRDRASGAAYEGNVRVTVSRQTFLGDDEVVYGPVDAALEERLFKFYPEFPDEANYLVRIEFEAEGAPWIVELPMVVGSPGSPWRVLGSVLTGFVLLVVAIRAVRIKQARRLRLAGAGV